MYDAVVSAVDTTDLVLSFLTVFALVAAVSVSYIGARLVARAIRNA